MRAASVAALIGLALSACGDTETQSGDAPSPVDTSVAGSNITLSPQAMDNAALTAINMTGASSATDADWIDLTTDGCRRGAWNWEVAGQMAEEFRNAHPDLASPDRPAVDEILWILVAQSCPDLVPAEALEGGPPHG
jgi:hypothetical protein